MKLAPAPETVLLNIHVGKQSILRVRERHEDGNRMVSAEFSTAEEMVPLSPSARQGIGDVLDYLLNCPF
jgi:hypothetical protein